ncbi:hypothetical protein ABH926_007784 [Catenulispora sp. GP43]|uniref:hypothetical protein n=1 Tax=Catenulispora sp. GP43 TaxID=3156263 RepID=UPI003513AAD8
MTVASARNRILMLDFPGRRPEAHLTELRLEDADLECEYLLTHPLPTELDTRAYAEQLCRRMDTDPRDAVAVVAYCAAAPLAAPIAARVGGPDRPPLPIVYLDPSRCLDYHLVKNYTEIARQIAGHTDLEERIPLLDVAALIPTPEEYLARIAADLTQRSRAVLAADGFTAAEADQAMGTTIDLYMQWLTYLVAVHHPDPPPPAADVLQLVSRDHPAEAAWLGIAPEQTVRFDCLRPVLAEDPGVRGALLAFLDRAATAAPTRM